MGKDMSDICRACGEEKETTWHILDKCPALENDRRFFFMDGETKSPPRALELWQFITHTRARGLLRHPEDTFPGPRAHDHNQQTYHSSTQVSSPSVN